MKKNLLDNRRRCLLTVESDGSYEERLQAELQEKAHTGVKSTAKEKKTFQRFVSTPDSPEALATIERITIKDLPKTIARYPQKRIVLPSGSRIYDFRTFTRGIVYMTVAFDTRGLGLEEKRLLPLLVRAIQMSGTKKHDFTKISTMMKTLTGSFFMYPFAGSDVHGRPVSCVMLKTKMLLSDTAPALELIGELLTEPDLCDETRLKASLSDMVTEFESGYSYSASSYAVMNASSDFSATAMESELNMGTELWFYLVNLKKALESGKTSYEALSVSLTKLWEKVFVRKAMTVHITSDVKDDCVIQLVSSFTDRFRAGKFVRISDYYRNYKAEPLSGMNRPKCYALPSGPAFNALAVRFPKDGDRSLVAATLLASVLSSGYLWETVRGVNGAYGVESHVDNMENLFVFSSYRDPSVELTLKTFVKALGQSIEPTEIEYAVVTIIGRELRPRTPQSKSSEAFRKVLLGAGTNLYLRRRKLLLEMKSEDLTEVGRNLISRLESDGSCTVVCGQDMARNQGIENSIALPL
jgi:Zn-dependent M16 (insulinase) family peptidase